MIGEREFQSRLNELASQPAARQPATFSEIWNASWNATSLDTLTGTGAPFDDALDELVGRVKAVTGKDVRQPRGLAGPQGELAATLAAIDQLGLDDKTRAEIEPLRDVRANAIRRAHKIEKDASDVAGATYGLSHNALAFAAGVVRQAVDPINLATTPLGGPLKGPLLKMALREFAIGAGVQAIQEPMIQSGRADLDLEAGPSKAVRNVLESGVGNLALGLFGRGVTSLYWRAAQAMPELPRPANWDNFSFTDGIAYKPDLAASGMTGSDLAAVARLAERDQVLDASVPSQPLRAELHPKIDRAAEALNQGRLPVEIEQRFETPELYGPPSPAPRFDFTPKRLAFADGDVQQLIRPDGSRLGVRPVVMELSDLVLSHNIDGVPNTNYPAALQPRDRAAPASRSWISETAAKLEPELLGRQPTAGQGAPVIGPDGVVESGNGRALLIARAYDRHPDRANAYREWLVRQGYDVGEFEFPVLVRVREGNVADRAAFAREANVSATASLSVREQALADAKQLDSSLLDNFKGGNIADLQNAAFVRAFADRAVAPEERPQFIGGDDRLSVAGAARVEAAMVARGWNDERLITGLYETTDPNTRAILGAFADTAPVAARLRAAIEEGRVPKEADPAPALLEAWQLVAQARDNNVRVLDAVNQIDLERGAVSDPVRDAVRLFFRDDALRQPAGRDVVSGRIENALDRALDQQAAVGDLFGESMTLSASLKAAALAGVEPADMPFGFRSLTGVVDRQLWLAADYDKNWRALTRAQPFDTIDDALARAPAHQERLVAALNRAKPERAEVRDPGVKAKRDRIEQKVREDYAGDVRRITDLVRAGVVVQDAAQADVIVRALGREFRVIDSGWKKESEGYFDRKLRVVMEDGTIAEVQFWPREIEAAKKVGHKLYEQRRALGPVSKDDPRFAALVQAEIAHWKAAAETLPPEWKAIYEAGAETGVKGSSTSSGSGNALSASANASRANASSSGSPLRSVEAVLPGSQPASPSTRVPPGPITARTPLLENQRSSGAITQEISPKAGENKPEFSGANDASVKRVPIGDQQLRADAERALTEAGGDFEVVIEMPDGTVKRGSARELLAEAEADAKAADELKDCMGIGANGASATRAGGGNVGA